MTICKLKNIKKQIGTFSLEIPEFTLEKGNIYSIIGPNGSGKSTFLDIISLVEIPDSGDYFYNGEKISFSNNNLLNYRRKISYLHQTPYIFSTSVFENIAMGLKFRKINTKKINHTVENLMEKLSLTKYRNKQANSLSGGEKQRVALARALAIDADIYLFDEVTSNIDIENVSIIEDLLFNIQKEKNATVLITTHSKRQAYRISDNVISIINGKVSNTLYENIYTGLIENGEENLKTMKIAKNVSIKFISNSTGTATISIPPKDIILSLEKLQSSALNNLQGKIIKIENQQNTLRISIDVGVKIDTVITEDSFKNLNLNINCPVWVTFKANCVKILS